MTEQTICDFCGKPIYSHNFWIFKSFSFHSRDICYDCEQKIKKLLRKKKMKK